MNGSIIWIGLCIILVIIGIIWSFLYEKKRIEFLRLFFESKGCEYYQKEYNKNDFYGKENINFINENFVLFDKSYECKSIDNLFKKGNSYFFDYNYFISRGSVARGSISSYYFSVFECFLEKDLPSFVLKKKGVFNFIFQDKNIKWINKKYYIKSDEFEGNGEFFNKVINFLKDRRNNIFLEVGGNILVCWKKKVRKNNFEQFFTEFSDVESFFVTFRIIFSPIIFINYILLLYYKWEKLIEKSLKY